MVRLALGKSKAYVKTNVFDWHPHLLFYERKRVESCGGYGGYWWKYRRSSVKVKNIILGLWEQGPPLRAFRNFFITGNSWGLFSRWSHYRKDGTEKVSYSKKSAKKAAKRMETKHGVHFSVHKCIYCDGYHLGKNRDNKYGNNPTSRRSGLRFRR